MQLELSTLQDGDPVYCRDCILKGRLNISFLGIERALTIDASEDKFIDMVTLLQSEFRNQKQGDDDLHTYAIGLQGLRAMCGKPQMYYSNECDHCHRHSLVAVSHLIGSEARTPLIGVCRPFDSIYCRSCILADCHHGNLKLSQLGIEMSFVDAHQYDEKAFINYVKELIKLCSAAQRARATARDEHFRYVNNPGEVLLRGLEF